MITALHLIRTIYQLCAVDNMEKLWPMIKCGCMIVCIIYSAFLCIKGLSIQTKEYEKAIFREPKLTRNAFFCMYAKKVIYIENLYVLY